MHDTPKKKGMANKTRATREIYFPHYVPTYSNTILFTIQKSRLVGTEWHRKKEGMIEEPKYILIAQIDMFASLDRLGTPSVANHGSMGIHGWLWISTTPRRGCGLVVELKRDPVDSATHPSSRSRRQP
jgi:hypothetical protein